MNRIKRIEALNEISNDLYSISNKNAPGSSLQRTVISSSTTRSEFTENSRALVIEQ